jgi:HEPN domain-containing protein
MDGFYIPPCYPSSYAEGALFEHLGPLQSEEAVTYARQIIEFVHSQMA